jgi:hypothetical protein
MCFSQVVNKEDIRELRYALIVVWSALGAIILYCIFVAFSSFR